MLYGVIFVDAPALIGTINQLVASARGNNEQLLAAWNNAR